MPDSLVCLFQTRAKRDASRRAFTFRHDDGSETSLTFGELDRRSRAIAASLQRRAFPGDRALLVYPAGLDVISAFCGCLYAGILAVPATYPKPRRPMPRLTAIGRDCGATIALTTSRTLATLELSRAAPELETLEWIATDELPDAGLDLELVEVGGEDLAYLQYTSGSTNEPKGVMVSHRNLMSNLEMIRQGFRIERTCDGGEPGTGVFWLPAYHDMGLIGGILMAIYTGGHSVLMSPASFLQRPIRWLQAISDYRANVSGGPNFGYELCVRKTTPRQRSRLDLGNWNVAFCGAEPIRSETLDRFAKAMAPTGFHEDAFYPCYGLAESTLLAAGGKGPARPVVKRVLRSALARHHFVQANGHDDGDVQTLVGCGGGVLDQELAIVNPQTKIRSRTGEVGEIWVKGPNVARGYWNHTRENDRVFGARMADSGDGPYLRTGDLGFVADGHLFVTGRLKEVIIVRGRNLYPQDVELTVQQCHPALAHGGGAAFAVEHEGEERLMVVHELDRGHRDGDLEALLARIRRVVVEEHDVDLGGAVLIRQASLPRTTSGKPQRSLCRQHYLSGELRVLAEWLRNGHPSPLDDPGGSTAGEGNSESDEEGLPKRPLRSYSAIVRLTAMRKPFDEGQTRRAADQIRVWLVEWLVERAGVLPEEIDPHKPYAEYGLDSLTAVELSQEIEDTLDVQITPTVAWNYPTLATMAGYLARVVGGVEAEPLQQPDCPADSPNGDFGSLLAEIENLSDEEAEAALKRRGNGSC